MKVKLRVSLQHFAGMSAQNQLPARALQSDGTTAHTSAVFSMSFVLVTITASSLPVVQEGSHLVVHLVVLGRLLGHLVQDKQVPQGQGRPVRGRHPEVPAQGRPQDRQPPGSLLPQQAGFPKHRAMLEDWGSQAQL